jgi:hypothetical protein
MQSHIVRCMKLCSRQVPGWSSGSNACSKTTTLTALVCSIWPAPIPASCTYLADANRPNLWCLTTSPVFQRHEHCQQFCCSSHMAKHDSRFDVPTVLTRAQCSTCSSTKIIKSCSVHLHCSETRCACTLQLARSLHAVYQYHITNQGPEK